VAQIFAHILWSFCLTSTSVFHIFDAPQSEFLPFKEEI
jgi:hypothetical protein